MSNKRYTDEFKIEAVKQIMKRAQKTGGGSNHPNRPSQSVMKNAPKIRLMSNFWGAV